MGVEAVRASDLMRWPRARWDGGALKRAVVSAAPGLLHGLRLTVSVCLALLIAYWLQLDNAHWAGTSAGIVAQPALGASMRKGQFRAIGTIVGGVIIVVLIAVFPQDHSGFLVSLALWAAICGFLATTLRNFAGYAAALAGYTTALVFAGIIENPQNVFMVAVWRVTEICIGIFCAVLVHSLTDFGDARIRLQRALSELGRSIACGVVQTLRTHQEDLQLRASRRALIGRVIALDVTIDEALGEPSHLRHCGGQLRAVLESLFCALSAWRGIASHLGTLPAQRTAQLVPALLASLSALADRVWSSDPAAIRERCRASSRRVEEIATPDVASRVLIDGVVRILHALESVANALLVVTTPGTERNGRGSTRVHVPDALPGMLDALRIVIAFGAAELFWVVTSWPHGPTMIIFSAIGVILFARQTDAAYSSALEFAIGCTLAAILAAILLLAVLPSIHGGFFALSLALALLLLPLGALSAGSWHKLVFVAAVTNLIPILAIENDTDYDAARLLNVAVAVVAGTAAAAILFRLLPPLPPERRTQRLLMLTLRDLRGLLRGRRRFSQDAWLGLLSQRLAVMPKESTLEEEAELLAALSVGQASVALRATRWRSTERATLDRALACLAEAKVAEAHDGLVRFAAAQSERPAASGERGIDAAVQATLIAGALQRHGPFFSQGR